MTEYAKTIIHTNAPFFISNAYLRIITVSTEGGDFSSIASAVQSINPSIPINTTNGSFTITSAGLFTANLSGASISGPGIQAGSSVTFVDANTMTMSLQAVNTASTTALFTRALPLRSFSITVGPGIYVEPQIILGSYISITGVNTSSCIVLPNGAFNLFELGSFASINNLVITGVNPNFWAVHARNTVNTGINSVIFVSCPQTTSSLIIRWQLILRITSTTLNSPGRIL